MIKAIPAEQTVSTLVADFCNDLSSLFTGEVDLSYATRLTAATDNSIYQVVPQAIVFPKSTDDIQALTKLGNQAKYKTVRFSPRGGGTGTNGQSLTPHIVVDLSRHMREILEINVEEKWVRVQTGVIKDQLNDFLRPYGFFFAPDLSTSNRATIGGMVNTDASGQGSLVYGKTSDHVLGLRSVLINGDVLDTESIASDSVLDVAKQSSDFINNIYQQVKNTCTEQRDNILATFPRLNRFLTGYDLENVFNDDLTTFNLSRVLTGSEGTLAFITEAKLNITPIAKFKTLINIKYDSFDSALRNSPFLVEAKATSVETVDSKVLNLAKQDVVWDTVSDLIQDVPDKVMDGLNIVEFNDEDEQNQANKVGSLCERLDALIENQQQGVIGYQITTDLASIGRIYAMRKKAVGLLGNAKSSKKPIAFVEDTAVPPENLADFISEFKQLLDSHKLDYGMFGHVDAGVLHVRPALDLTDPKQEQLLREISDHVVTLTAKYGGLMWGEHGKGYRSEYGPEFFGEDLFNELRKIKAAFDPDNRLNPGKICTPFNSEEKLVTVDDKKRAAFDKAIPIDVKTEFETTVNCNGNGLCFNYDTASPMCPSYKATKDRRMSPKGRASLMREWLRHQPKELLEQGQSSGLLQKFVNTVKGKWLGEYDYSHEVKEAMDTCLACKACSTACPIKVDVPTFRSKFISLYHQRYLRPASDYLVANIESLLPVMAKVSGLVNVLSNNAASRWFVKHAFGYVDMPLLTTPLNKLIDKKYFYSAKNIKELSDEQKQKAVYLVQDPFTSNYESQLVADTIKVLDKLGFYPFILPFTPNGKPQHVKGFLEKFSNTAKRSTAKLNKIAKDGVPMIGLDASLVFAYRDEYVKELGADQVKFDVSLLSEWLIQQSIELDQSYQSQPVSLLTHCTEKSVIANVSQQWQQIFSKFGIELKGTSTGCCGMAGTFGHEKPNQTISKDLYALSWQPLIEKPQQPEILATGFSCRSQVKRLSAKQIKHPVQYLADLM